MAEYTKRVQAVLSDEQYTMLNDLSEKLGKPVSRLIREAVEKVYIEEAAKERRRAALAKILALEPAPVSDWEQMEEEIIQGYLE